MRPSLYEELEQKLQRDPRLTKRGGPRVDLSLLLFNARADLHALWLAAEQAVAGGQQPSALSSAVEALRPIFGSR